MEELRDINSIDRAIYESEKEIESGAKALDAVLVFAELDKKILRSTGVDNNSYENK
ncbi:hypothetical protein M2145_001905 [Lachnospiraceae bacterium PF1-21]|uniref:Uncharacterized protein n=1 Tax=Ohessyouella blattaphilus TaxID=2949333 RepID=A0ABT1ELF7_9FIRM|nr:hypothetical protein [Ohessyouella blattaphilus]MCP1111540.1 hypothetical protein [Ohessyouella blattaphilus]MCR8564934.1 hypothetical protein [Ohessyouella blattaphilus]MDL2251117.1 hypothetical protein [Lachnospiraceae bacterium OttesenSCG-928-J05]